MVRNRRYARDRLASECTMHGLRCMKGRRSSSESCSAGVSPRSSWSCSSLRTLSGRCSSLSSSTSRSCAQQLALSGGSAMQVA